MQNLEEELSKYAKTLSEEGGRKYMEKLQKFLKKMEQREFPYDIFENIRYQKNLPKLKTQGHPDSCGTGSIAGVLALDFGIIIQERRLWEEYERVTGKTIQNNGISPTEIAQLKPYIEERTRRKLKMFCTSNGNLRQLRKLREMNITPIINRPWHEPKSNGDVSDPKEENHYEYLIACEEYVYLFNPANEKNNKDKKRSKIEKSGFHKMPIRKFMEKWWVHNNGERWYMIIIPEEVILPNHRLFNGKYL